MVQVTRYPAPQSLFKNSRSAIQKPHNRNGIRKIKYSVHGNPSLLCSNTDKFNGYTDILNGPTHHLLGQIRAMAGRAAIAAVQTDPEDGNCNACRNVGKNSLRDSTPQAHPTPCPLWYPDTCTFFSCVFRHKLVMHSAQFARLPYFRRRIKFGSHCREPRDIILFLSHHTRALAIPLRSGSTQRTLSD